MKSLVIAVACVLAAAPAALAQGDTSAQKPAAAPPAAAPASPPAFLHVRDTPEIIDQDTRSEALNAEVNRKNAAIQAGNDAAKKAYDLQLADYQAQTKAQKQAQADYEAKLAAIKVAAEKAKADYEKSQADYAKAQADWQKRVSACKAGDRTACAP